MSAATRPAVLFLTSSEYGQANVILATAYEFLLRDEFDVHIASYAYSYNNSFAKRVEWLNDKVSEVNGQKAIFHKMAGLSMVNYALERGLMGPHKPGLGHAVESYRNLSRFLIRDDTENYLKAYDSCLEIIEKVKPVVAVVEPLCMPGIDAVQAAGVKFVQLYPTSLDQICAYLQTKGELFWKFPIVSSGYPYPLPLHLIPANVYLVLQLIVQFIIGPTAKKVFKARADHGINTELPVRAIMDGPILCSSLLEIDFPLNTIPSNIVPCGPILFPSTPVSKTDPSLDKWLSQYPTILICLGTHHNTDPNSALEMAQSVSTILTQKYNLQVLWKLRYGWESDPKFQKILKSVVDADRLRITSWLIPETIDILSTSQIAAFVHHGGAGVYNESCYTGTPQVVLPVWCDTYVYAAKVEYHGLGVYASKKSAPGANKEELTAALKRVLEDEKIKEKARSIKEICRKTVGREVSCDRIVDLAKT